MWAAAALFVANLASEFMSSAQGSKEAQRQAESFGRRSASIKESAARIRQAQPEQVSAVEENRLNAKFEIEKSQEQAEAHAKVSAAAAGVEGASVTNTILDTEASAGRAIGNVENVANQQLRQLRQNAIQLSLDTDAQIGELDLSNRPRRNQQELAGFLNAGTKTAGQAGLF